MHSVLHKANVERSARLKQQTLQQQQQQQYQLQLQQQQYSMQQEYSKITQLGSVTSKDLYKYASNFTWNWCEYIFYNP